MTTMRIETITDECPRHDADIKAEYTFGRQDATVLVYTCGCCVAYKDDGFLGGRLFDTYGEAEGYARLAKMQNQMEDAAVSSR